MISMAVPGWEHVQTEEPEQPCFNLTNHLNHLGFCDVWQMRLQLLGEASYVT